MITIATLRAAGLSDSEILRIIELDQNERLEKEREQSKIRSRNYRERHRVTEITRDARDERDGVYPSSLLPDLSSSDSKEEERLFLVATGREFAEFWKRYPHKVGKRAAEKAFRSARKRASFEAIIAGLDRYAAKTDDRPWCNPATWLNQDRWEDQEGPTQEGKAKGGGTVVDLEKERERQEYLAMHQKQGEIARQMRAQGASQDEIKKALWSPEVAGRWASDPRQLG